MYKSRIIIAITLFIGMLSGIMTPAHAEDINKEYNLVLSEQEYYLADIDELVEGNIENNISAKKFEKYVEEVKKEAARKRAAELQKKKEQKIREAKAKEAKRIKDKYASMNRINSWYVGNQGGGDRSAFSLEPYRLNWSAGSVQRQIHLNDGRSYTDSNGFRRYQLMSGKRNYDTDLYVVALGSRFGKDLGSVYRITFSNGDSIYAMLGDQKADGHTDGSNSYHDPNKGGDGSWVEVIVENSVVHGSSYGGKSHWNAASMPNSPFQGSVVQIESFDKNMIS